MWATFGEVRGKRLEIGSWPLIQTLRSKLNGSWEVHQSEDFDVGTYQDPQAQPVTECDSP